MRGCALHIFLASSKYHGNSHPSLTFTKYSTEKNSLVCDFEGVGIAHSIGVIGEHLLRPIIGLQAEFIRGLVVAFADSAGLEGILVVGLQVHIIDLTLKLHGQGPGWTRVDKAWPVA